MGTEVLGGLQKAFENLRKWLLPRNTTESIASFVTEARIFEDSCGALVAGSIDCILYKGCTLYTIEEG